MDKVAVGCCVFQDVQGVLRLIESCWKKVDYIFLIDGKYKFYDADFPLSTDNLDYETENYPNVLIEYAPDLLEHEKRNKYLELCKEFKIDFLLIVDSDEYFIDDSDWEQFRKELPMIKDSVTNIKSYTSIEGMKIPVDYPRLWKNPAKMEYKNDRHYQFGLKDSDVVVAKNTIYSIKLIHDPSIHSDERKEKHDQYIKKLEEYERLMQLVETNKEKATREYVVWNS
jgi:hypothetical protein